jgi:hypothetical protein
LRYITVYNSLIIALSTTYPEKKWVEPERKPNGYWRDLQNQRTFFNQLAVKLNIQHPEDWYKVHKKTVINFGGTFIDSSLYGGSIRKGNNKKFIKKK